MIRLLRTLENETWIALRQYWKCISSLTFLCITHLYLDMIVVYTFTLTLPMKLDIFTRMHIAWLCTSIASEIAQCARGAGNANDKNWRVTPFFALLSVFSALCCSQQTNKKMYLLPCRTINEGRNKKFPLPCSMQQLSKYGGRTINSRKSFC